MYINIQCKEEEVGKKTEFDYVDGSSTPLSLPSKKKKEDAFMIMFLLSNVAQIHFVNK